MVIIAPTTIFLAGLKYISRALTSPRTPEPLLWMNTKPMSRGKYFVVHKKYAAFTKKGKSTASVTTIIEDFP